MTWLVGLSVVIMKVNNMAKHKLTNAQKDEIRRLTQLANRRIKTAEKQYRQAGKMVAPKDVVGHVQTKDKWHTPNTPLTRSVVFESKEDYQRQLRFLQSFDPKAPGSPRQKKQTMSDYTKVQRAKTAQAMQTSLGVDVPLSVLERINELTAPELSEFWKRYSEKSSKLGVKYSSLQAMQETLNELFPEDVKQFEGIASDLGNRAT